MGIWLLFRHGRTIRIAIQRDSQHLAPQPLGAGPQPSSRSEPQVLHYLFSGRQLLEVRGAKLWRGKEKNVREQFLRIAEWPELSSQFVMGDPYY